MRHQRAGDHHQNVSVSFAWAGVCVEDVERFCGPEICSISGNWHIAWQMPLNGLLSEPITWLSGFDWGLHALTYIEAAFYLPILNALAASSAFITCWAR